MDRVSRYSGGDDEWNQIRPENGTGFGQLKCRCAGLFWRLPAEREVDREACDGQLYG